MQNRTLKSDDILKHKPSGKKVRVLAADSDPTALVWIAFVDEPDRDDFVPRSDLEAA